MYASTATRLGSTSSRVEKLHATITTTTTATTAATAQRICVLLQVVGFIARGPVGRGRAGPSLLHQVDGGDALVAVLEDELHETLVRGVVRGARSTPEREASLLHRGPDHERGERPGRDLDLP